MNSEELKEWIDANWADKLDKMSGPTSERPTSVTRPTMFLDTQTKKLSFWVTDEWVEGAGGGSGSGSGDGDIATMALSDFQLNSTVGTEGEKKKLIIKKVTLEATPLPIPKTDNYGRVRYESGLQSTQNGYSVLELYGVNFYNQTIAVKSSGHFMSYTEGKDHMDITLHSEYDTYYAKNISYDIPLTAEEIVSLKTAGINFFMSVKHEPNGDTTLGIKIDSHDWKYETRAEGGVLSNTNHFFYTDNVDKIIIRDIDGNIMSSSEEEYEGQDLGIVMWRGTQWHQVTTFPPIRMEGGVILSQIYTPINGATYIYSHARGDRIQGHKVDSLRIIVERVVENADTPYVEVMFDDAWTNELRFHARYKGDIVEFKKLNNGSFSYVNLRDDKSGTAMGGETLAPPAIASEGHDHDLKYALLNGNTNERFEVKSTPPDMVTDPALTDVAVNNITMTSYVGGNYEKKGAGDYAPKNGSSANDFNAKDFKAHGTMMGQEGVAIKGFSTDSTMRDYRNDVATTEYAVKHLVSSKIPTEARMIFARKFNGNQDIYLVNDQWLYVSWEAAKKCFRFMAKPSGNWGWYDAGMVLFKSDSRFTFNDDISSSSGGWKYFGESGTYTNNFRMDGYACSGWAIITQEGFGNTPSYRIDFMTGNAGSVSVMVWQINR